MSGIRPPFVDDIKHLRGVAETLDTNKEELDRTLQVLPIKLNKVGRTAAYGSWFNFYLCDFTGTRRCSGTRRSPSPTTRTRRGVTSDETFP